MGCDQSDDFSVSVRSDKRSCAREAGKRVQAGGDLGGGRGIAELRQEFAENRGITRFGAADRDFTRGQEQPPSPSRGTTRATFSVNCVAA